MYNCLINNKNVTEVTLNLSSNLTGSSKDEINFSHNSLLTKTRFKYSKSFCKWLIS